MRPEHGSWWFAWITDESGARTRLACVESSAHPDGAFVEIDAAQAVAGAASDWFCAADIDNGAVTTLAFGESLSAPPMWFVEVRESAADPPATNLLAFTSHGQPAGRLVDESGFSNIAAANDDQLGAVRWYPVSGVVNQIYVAPDWRRRGIGTGLLAAAAVLSVARGWPRLWGQGQRTALGEQFRNGSRWWPRAGELTHLAPPMTPGDTGA